MPNILSQNKPAKHKKAVVFCADRNVVRFAQFVANQIMLAEPERGYDICITTFDGEIVTLDKVDPEIRVCQIAEEPFSALRTDSRITSTAYILLGLPEIFAEDYEKVVYLDTDVFLRSGTISDLFAAASGDFAVTGVLDSTQWHTSTNARQLAYWEALGISDAPYLNTGILVMDLEKCRGGDFYRGTMQAALQLSQIKKDNPNILFLHDQSAINMHLKGQWAPLSLRWNWQTYDESSRLVKHFDPYIMHFVSKTKPWVSKPVAHTKDFLPEYVRFFENVLGENLLGKTYQTQKVKDPFSWKLFLRHELSWATQRERLNIINPLYYTRLRGLIPVYLQRINIAKIEQAIATGSRVWPHKAMIAGLK